MTEEDTQVITCISDFNQKLVYKAEAMKEPDVQYQSSLKSEM